MRSSGMPVSGSGFVEVGPFLAPYGRTRPGEGAQLEAVRPGRMAPAVLSELRSILGEAKADEFLALVKRIAG